MGFAKVTRDLTERRRSEEERIRLTQTREALRLRDEFLSIAAHELRTPLNGLQLGFELLSAIEGLPGRAPQIVARLRRCTALLVRLTDALLDGSRITAGKLQLAVGDVDLNAMLADVVDRMSDEAARAASPLRLRVGEPLRGQWDPMRVEQVVMNLLSNAIKYGPSHPIEIEAGLDGGCARIAVIDHGPGIKE